MGKPRIDSRSNSELRKVTIVSGDNPYAEGSVIVSFGNTKVLVTASVEKEVPRWMSESDEGWITAEYGMLPRATHTRNRREAGAGKQSGRTLEIQRLIGRSLRAAVDLKSIPGITIKLDCDVLVADGGTRTASITGAWVALRKAITWAENEGLVNGPVSMKQIAAVSVGAVDGDSLLDLCYEEDSNAEFDLNLVFNSSGEVVEIQGTAEGRCLSRETINELMELGWGGVETLLEIQSASCG